ncbi:MAG: YfhO family protein, partial [Chloroflexota bacterium]
YDGGLLPTRDYARFKALLVTAEPPVPHYTLPPQADGRADHDLLGALNVRHLLTDGRNGAPGPDWIVRAEAPGAAWLYEHADVAPRAFLVHEIEGQTDLDAALRQLARLDLRRQALLDLPAAALPPVDPVDAGGPTRQARIVRYSAQEVEIETEADGAALLVVTDSYYPGWRATIDGRPAPVLRANLLFRGIPLPAGAHRVRLWFDPLSVKLGFGLSVIALGANLLGLLATWPAIQPWVWRRGR